MPLSQEKYDKIKQITVEYLQALELIDIHQQNELTDLQYHPHCMMKLFAPTESWRNYVEKVGVLTNGLVNHKSIGIRIDEALNSLPIPLGQELCEKAATKLADIFNLYCDHHTISYVPLSNISMSNRAQPLQLANATLYHGHSLDNKDLLEQLYDSMKNKNIDLPRQICFLKLDTYGDDESIERQIVEKTQESLKVLRFCSWTYSTINGYTVVSYNRAKDVDYFPYHTPSGYYFFANEKGHLFNRYVVKRSNFEKLNIGLEEVSFMNLMGRESLNSHFMNPDNRISQRVQLALDWYDNGLKAHTNQDAVYRFLLCINAIVFWDHGDDLTVTKMKPRLKKLFATASFYKDSVYHINLYGNFSDLNDLSNWNASGKSNESIVHKIIEGYTSLFENLYKKYRNPILHTKLLENVKSKDVKNVQLLAQNGLRLLLKLISENPNWTSTEDVHNWFNSSSIN